MRGQAGTFEDNRGARRDDSKDVGETIDGMCEIDGYERQADKRAGEHADRRAGCRGRSGWGRRGARA